MKILGIETSCDDPGEIQANFTGRAVVAALTLFNKKYL